ncbi:vinorine synthase, partial [Quercus suber]
MPFCVFYPQDRRANLSNLERCDWIKKSLSEVLTLFYLLAGRVKVNLYIDCNDEGVLYVESKANCQLSEFLENPIPTEVNKFLPIQALAIQVTTFNCGRMHKIVIKRFVYDASSIVALRAKYSTDNNNIANPRPSHMEVLSAFIWSRYLAAQHNQNNPNKIYAVFHAADLHKRLDPPLSEQYFGNISLSTASV